MAFTAAGSLLTRPAPSLATTSQVAAGGHRAAGAGRPTPVVVTCGGYSTSAPPARGSGGGGGVDFSKLRSFSVEDAVQYSKRHAEYLEKVRSHLLRVESPGKAMETVDTLQRLGIDYHFGEEVGTLLSLIYDGLMSRIYNTRGGGGGDRYELHDVALSFRLLRQAGNHVPTDAFDRFIDGKGDFQESASRDVGGLLSLHEASYLGLEGEHLLDEAQTFSRRHLEASLDWLEPHLALQVRDALDHPYHMTHQRYKARRYLEQFLRYWEVRRRPGSGDDGLFVLGELARLDFTMVQSLHRMELLRFSKWWHDLGMSRELEFARNQPVKWYVGAMATLSDPGLPSDHRFELAKCVALVHIVDDIFDVRGSLEELVLFTDAVRKWDLREVGTLPSYMQMCYATLHQVTNDIALKVCKEHGWEPISSLKKSWLMLFEAFLVEARWFASGHVPTTDEYLRNGVVSSGMHVVSTHAFFLLGHNLSSDSADWVEGVPALISTTATILRLWDDLGSSEDEEQVGFDGSYVQSHMREHEDCCTEDAKRQMMGMISDSWKRLNAEALLLPAPGTTPAPTGCFSRDFAEACLNMARMVKAAYSYEQDSRQLPLLESFVNLLLLQRAP